MARTDNLKNLFTDIADSIRTKTKSTSKIQPKDFDTQILSIQSEPNLQEKEIEITENGETTITADETYDGLSSVSITTNVSGGSDTKYTGSYDIQGLKAIGYDDETIEWYQKNGVCWNEESNNLFLVSDYEKSMYGNLIDTGSQPTQSSPSVIGTGSAVSMRGRYAFLIRFMPLFELYQNRTSLSYGFSSNNIVTIPNIDTSKITRMDYMFTYCPSLITIPLINTNNVTRMDYMFSYCRSLATIPLLNTEKVTNMSNMFSNCVCLKTLPLIDTHAVTDMSYMFYYCGALSEIPLLNTNNVKSMSSMFYYCYTLTKIPLLNTQNVTTMAYMFNYCQALTTIPLFNTQNVTNMSYMFFNCTSLQEIPLFDTRNVTNMNSMFYGCFALKKFPRLDMTKVTNVGGMFNNCYSLEEIDLSGMNLSKITNSNYMSGMFTNCGTFKIHGALPKVYVSSEDDQTWVLTKSNGHPTTWSTDNVIVAGSEQDLRGE